MSLRLIQVDSLRTIVSNQRVHGHVVQPADYFTTLGPASPHGLCRGSLPSPFIGVPRRQVAPEHGEGRSSEQSGERRLAEGEGLPVAPLLPARCAGLLRPAAFVSNPVGGSHPSQRCLITRLGRRDLEWRRERDSNPRDIAAYTISSRARSAGLCHPSALNILAENHRSLHAWRQIIKIGEIFFRTRGCTGSAHSPDAPDGHWFWRARHESRRSARVRGGSLFRPLSFSQSRGGNRHSGP